jgi:hypothetical protein
VDRIARAALRAARSPSVPACGRDTFPWQGKEGGHGRAPPTDYLNLTIRFAREDHPFPFGNSRPMPLNRSGSSSQFSRTFT